MFGSKKKNEEPDKTELVESKDATPSVPKGHNPSKGAPTPRRKDVEAARRRPIVSDSSTMTKEEKKAKKAEQRRKSNVEYAKEQEAMKTGDEKNYPYQHQGPERAFGRDYIDASGPLSALFMPVALLLLPVIFLQTRLPEIMGVLTIVIYVFFVIMIAQAFVLALRAKDLVGYNFGWNKIPRGFFMQMMGRCFYLRRWRQPVPRVARGDYPEGSSRADLRAARKQKRANKKNK